MNDTARAGYPLEPKNTDPGSTEQTCGCFYDSEENRIYLCAGHAGAAERTSALRAALAKARTTMDVAAHILRGLEDDPEAARVALMKLDYGRQEAVTELLLADPGRASEEWRALRQLESIAKKHRCELVYTQSHPDAPAEPKCFLCGALAAVERSRRS